MKNFLNYFKSIVGLFSGFFKEKLIVISTFNGIGSFSESMKQLGVNFEMDTVCEIDKSANDTYYQNNPYVEERHVNDINDLLENIKSGKKCSILIQTPPCQSFSTQGKREGFKSDNGNLFLTSIKLQMKIDSQIVIYENVKGLVNHHKTHYYYENKNGETVEFDSKPKQKTIEKEGLKLLRTEDLSKPSLINPEYDGKKKSIGNTLHCMETLFLEDTRYNYYWKVIGSNDIGLPQNRERIFIIGIKKELDKGFKFPENKDLQYTVEDILEKDIPENFFVKNSARHKIIKKNQKRRPNKIHTYGEFEKSMNEFDSSRRVFLPYVSPTIMTDIGNKFLIDGEVRFLTQTEKKRIHSFREEFEFVGSKRQINKQLGNTVSPGVYVQLLTSLFNTVTLQDEVPTKTIKSKSKRGRKPKETVVIDNHISLSKSITNNPDKNYLTITEERFQEYLRHLKNGGTMSLTIDKFKDVEDKKNGVLENRFVVSINDLERLGFRDKKNGIYNVKITGSIDRLEKVGKRDVIYTRQGGKTICRGQISDSINEMKLYENKISTVVDCFFGGGGFSFPLIENLNFDKYIINDLEPLIYKTILGVKKDYKKVIEEFNRINTIYLKKRELYDKSSKDFPEHKKFYQEIGRSLNDKSLNDSIFGGRFIFFISRSSSGVLKYDSKGKIDLTNCDNSKTPMKNKVPMIKYWSYLLNKFKIEIYCKNVLDLLDEVPKDSLILSDGPYISVKNDYGMDNSSHFQIELKNKLNKFQNLIYFNEDCPNLYKLNLHSEFKGIKTFPRKNTLGVKNKKVGYEFLGYRSSFMTKVNENQTNTKYQPKLKKVS